MFLTLMVVGLTGLFLMAFPAFGRHHAARGAHLGHGASRLLVRGGRAGAAASALGWLPSPRAVCSVLALYGAFGNALVHAGHRSVGVAAIVAAVPALLVERFLVRPVWNLLFRFESQPSSPLDALVLSEARAVVPFRNGRGLVSVVRDGRVVQLSATLRPDQTALSVRVGDRVRVEEVDGRRERLTVSLVDPKE
jgi:hypothetical protein